MIEKIKYYWTALQDLLEVEGGLYVDLMCIVITARLLGVFFHFPPMTYAEAGVWGTTIATFGYSNKNGGKPS